MIKLLLPTNKIINIQLSGDETELKDLISVITDLSPSQIKGIKDSQGNYYTISSALKSLNIFPSKENQYYELIWSKVKYSQLTPKKSLNDDNKLQHIILNSSPNVGNYYTNYYINEQSQQKKNDLLLNLNSEQIGAHFPEIYLVYLKKFFEKKLISQNQLNDISKMVNHNNAEIIQLFNNFIDGKIKLSDLIKGLWTFYDKKITPKKRRESKKKVSLSSKEISIDVLLQKLELFFNSEDMVILKEMIKFENEMILDAVKDYWMNKKMDNLIETIKNSVNKYKNKKFKKKSKPKSSANVSILSKEQFFIKKTISSDSNKSSKEEIEKKLETEVSNEKKTNHLTGESIKNFAAKAKRVKSTKVMKEMKINRNKPTLHIQSNTQIKANPITIAPAITKTTQSNRIRSTLKISSIISSELSDINKIIFRYIKDNNIKEYENVKNLFKQTDKKQMTKVLNDYLTKVFTDTLAEVSKKTKHLFRKQDICLLVNFINSKYPSVVKVFNEFDKHFSLSTLQKDLFEIIQREQVDSASSSDDGNESSNEAEDINVSFINDLDKIQISTKEKEKLIIMLKSDNAKIKDIIQEYSNTRNIADLKNKIHSLLNKNNGGTILKKLKSRDSPKKLFLPGTQSYNEIKPMSLKAFSDYKEIITYLETHNFFSSEQIALISNGYKEKDEAIISCFNNYFKNNNFSDLANILTNYLKEISNGIDKKNKKSDVTKTPDTIKRSKNELNFFLKTNEQQIAKKEKNVLEKQKEIIYLLFKEKCINKNTFDLINKKIEEDEQTLIAAFEVYAVTKDHNEFIETLKIIADLSEDYKGTFNILLNNANNFNESQKAKLLSLYNEKDDALLSALEVYEEKKDKEDVYNSFQIILKRNSKK